MHRYLLAVLATTFLLALPASAAAEIQITVIQYNSPGPDTGTNASLNGEFVTLKNTGIRPKNLEGWHLVTSEHHAFRFPQFFLSVGETVHIRTGRGTDGPSNLYWGRKVYEWNNAGDTATLIKHDGVIRQRCAYIGTPAGRALC
jgi:Lamin Tail Domain